MSSTFALLAATILVATGSPLFSADGTPAADPPPFVIFAGDNARSRGAVAYKEKMTVMDAILLTGGIATFGDPPIYLIRDAKCRRLSLRGMAPSGQGIPLKPWDIIYIGR